MSMITAPSENTSAARRSCCVSAHVCTTAVLISGAEAKPEFVAAALIVRLLPELILDIAEGICDRVLLWSFFRMTRDVSRSDVCARVRIVVYIPSEAMAAADDLLSCSREKFPRDVGMKEYEVDVGFIVSTRRCSQLQLDRALRPEDPSSDLIFSGLTRLAVRPPELPITLEGAVVCIVTALLHRSCINM